jgi:CofD-related protein of GAK system
MLPEKSIVDIPSSSGLVFISGGSALNKLARLFAASYLQATHVIAVFDNGGSTARLRKYCGIAIGDIRNRLVAISSKQDLAAEKIAELFSIRLPSNKSPQLMRRTVEELAERSSDYLIGIPSAQVAEVSLALNHLLLRLPEAFDWRDGSIGNFILVGRYLQDKHWEATLKWATQRLSAFGLVLPSTIESAHLGAYLRNGTSVVGQDRLTDEARPIRSPVDRLILHPTDKSSAKTIRVSVYPPSREEIANARSIVYSWGSFYTSVLSSFLVDGLAEAVLQNPSPKVLLLNPLPDAETLGKRPADLVREITFYALRNKSAVRGTAVTHVLALRSRSSSAAYFYHPSHREEIENLGVQVIEVECEGTPKTEQLKVIMEQLLNLSGVEPNRACA